MNNKIPIADLHCDLLCYLQGDPRRSAFDAAVRCSLPQMQQGGVSLQVLPIFTETVSGSTQKGFGQVEAYSSLFQKHPDIFIKIRTKSDLERQGNKIGLLLSIENASGLFEEDEPLNFKSLESLSQTHRIVYISPTWNSENRFGGGALTDVGLKEDGKTLLHFLHGRNIAYDCSHNSDRLMQEAFAYMDKHQLQIPILASHSNMRSVTSVPRNLPDPLVREILQRGGLIGMNFYRPFVGAEMHFFSLQLEHLLKLGGEKHICFGADFFHDYDLPPALQKKPQEMFFAEVSDSSAYPTLLNLWKQELGLSQDQLHNIAYNNLHRFLLNISLV